MKGVIFREYIDFVSDVFGDEMADMMIEGAELASGGSYTKVGKYDWKELTNMVTILAKKTDNEPDTLVRAFGQHLLGELSKEFSSFFEPCETCFDLIQTVDSLIHVEVKKLYPDAELPTLETHPLEKGGLCVIYTSCRPFGQLCLGMIEGSAAHFGDEIELTAIPHQKGLTIEVRPTVQNAA